MRALVARLRESRGFLLGLLGLTLWWPLLRRPTGFYVLAGHDFSPVASCGWYALFLGCVICFSVSILAMSSRVRFCAQSRKARVAAVGVSCVQFVCKLVELFVAPSGTVAVLLALIDVVFYAFIFVWLTCVWAAWVLCLRPSRCALACCVSFFVEFLSSGGQCACGGGRCRCDGGVPRSFRVVRLCCLGWLSDEPSW